MSQHDSLHGRSNMRAIKALTYMMFAMFAMTTDSVGIIIPEIVRTFRLSLTAAGSFQYATMAGIAVAGFLLGHLADRFGRKTTILIGLMLFAAASFLFLAGTSFLFFCVLMALSGIAIAIFKTGGARSDRRYRAIDGGTHVDHELGGRLFRRRFHCGAGAALAVVESRRSLAVAVRNRGRDVRSVDFHRSQRSLSQPRGSRHRPSRPT